MGLIKLPKESINFFNENLSAIFDSGQLAEGPWIDLLANWAKDFTNCKYSVIFNSNGSGIFSILSILKKFRHKKTYFIQRNTMYGVKALCEASGLNFSGMVECSLHSLMPTLKQVNEFLDTLDDPTTSVFVITHIGGIINPEIKEIASLCKSKGVVLVEDCAHSLGSTLNQEHSGTFGLAGVYSLYSTKSIPAGEGGIAITNDAEIADYLKRYIEYDRFKQEMNIGVNFRMSEINALLAFSVIKETQNIIKQKETIAKRYIEVCDKQGITFISQSQNSNLGNYYKFTLIDTDLNNCERYKKIKSRTSPVYDYDLKHQQPCKKEDISSNHICLPIWYQLDEEIIEKTLAELEKC